MDVALTRPLSGWSVPISPDFSRTVLPQHPVFTNDVARPHRGRGVQIHRE